MTPAEKDVLRGLVLSVAGAAVIVILAIVLSLLSGCATATESLPDGRVISSPTIDLPPMLYCVDADARMPMGCAVWRSAQPTADQFVNLRDRFAVKSVVKLNKAIEERDVLPPGVEPLEHPWMFVGPVSHDEVLSAIYDIEHAPKPVVIHCTHGVDRTGFLVAMWRVLHEHVPAASAWAEWRAFPRSKYDVLLYLDFERETGFKIPVDER